MITITTYNPHRSLPVFFYEAGDVDFTQVIPWSEVNKGHIGQFVKFDDGTNLYAKILNATSRIVITSAGQFRKADLVHCAVPKDPQTTIYGCDMREVHPLVRPYTNYEIHNGLKFLNNPEDNSVTLTKRIKMFTLEELAKAAKDDESYDARDVYRALKEAASIKNVDGKHFWKALKSLTMMHSGVDLDNIGEEMHGKLLGTNRQIDGGQAELREIPNKRILVNIASGGKS